MNILWSLLLRFFTWNNFAQPNFSSNDVAVKVGNCMNSRTNDSIDCSELFFPSFSFTFGFWENSLVRLTFNFISFFFFFSSEINSCRSVTVTKNEYQFVVPFHHNEFDYFSVFDGHFFVNGSKEVHIALIPKDKIQRIKYEIGE